MTYTYLSVRSCLATGISLISLVVAVVTLRVALRWRASSKIINIEWNKYLDDLFCLLALAPTIGMAVLLIYGAKKDIVGNHNDASNVEDWINTTTPTLVILEKLVYIMFILQPLALGFTKLAFLFFYRRIFVFPGFKRTSLIFIILTIGWMIAFFIGFVFDCRLNFTANWGSLASISENCPFGFEATIVFAITDAAFDLCILFLPLPWIWRLMLPTSKKLQLFGVFMLGGLAVAAALVRMVVIIKMNTPSNALEQQYIMGMPTYDIIGITSFGIYWAVVETNVALIACCLPTLRPILSMAPFSTVAASVGSIIQAMGTAMGTQRNTPNNSNAPSGRFSRLAVVTIGSGGRVPKPRDYHDHYTSEVSLVDLERNSDHVDTRDEVVIYGQTEKIKTNIVEKRHLDTDSQSSTS